MVTDKSDSMVQKALKSLCQNYGWSYGVFWRFDHRNSLLLTLEDAYYEEKMGSLIDNMLLQVHMLGNGDVGQAAFTKKHRWMFSNGHCRGHNPLGSKENRDIFQDDSEISCQFSAGIETIALISVEAGVVQFGGTQKIPERMDFVDQTKILFREIDSGYTCNLQENTPSNSNSEIYGLSGLYASLLSPRNSFPGNPTPTSAASSRNYLAPPCSLTDLLPWLSPLTSAHETMNSVHLGNPLQSNKSSVWLQEPLLQSTSYFNHSTAPSPCINSWSSGHSTLTSIEPKAQSRLVNPQNVSSANRNSAGGLVDLDKRSTSPTKFRELFDMGDFTTISRSMNGAEVLGNIPVTHPSTYAKFSITNTLNSTGNKMFFSDSCVENDLFDGLGADFEWVQAEDFLDDILMPVVSGNVLDFSPETSQCISGQRVGSVVGPQETLFSKLGLEHFSDGIAGSSNSVASSSFGDELSSAKKRKLGSCSVSGDQVHNLDRSHKLEPKKSEGIPRSEAGSWIGDGYSVTCGSSIVSQPNRSEKSVKISKKRARPGSRPKPKDRQLIQDRIAELRKLIPNGVKMSIDSLLAQTIKHMLFLQSVTNHAEKLKQAEDRKEKETVLKDNPSSSGYNGSWACEVGAHTMVDPVDVKDLNPHGHMLIQMLCEERGFFLEIVDIIQGLGLVILKGLMEGRENKIWACFVVEAEASRHVTKQEIYLSLHQLLYQKATSEVNVHDQLTNVLNGGITLFDNYHQPLVPLPVSLADALD